MRELESLVGVFAGECGLGADDKARTLIMLEELLTNLSRYGYPEQGAREELAEVTLELEGDRLTIEFGDNGQEFNPLIKPTPDLEQSVESRPIGGLGLHMVRELAQEARYSRRDGRNIVRLSRRVALGRTS